MISLEQTATNAATLGLWGRIDVTNGAELRAHVDALLSRGVTEIVVDVSRVEFLDSAGLAALIRLVVGARRLGGDAVLVGTDHPPVARMLDLTGFAAILTTATGGAASSA